MAEVRVSGRNFSKPDSIEALVVTRATTPTGPTCRSTRTRGSEVRLLVAHRRNACAERTRAIYRLRLHLHELGAECDPTPRSLDRASNYAQLETLLAGLVARLAHREI